MKTTPYSDKKFNAIIKLIDDFIADSNITDDDKYNSAISAAGYFLHKTIMDVTDALNTIELLKSELIRLKSLEDGIKPN